MAKRVVTQLIDDISGEIIEDGGETIRFTVNDASYSIDLGPENAAAFRDALSPYLQAAEKLGGLRRGGDLAPRRAGARTDPAQLAAIRSWARSAGYELSDRGRIPVAVQEAYEAAHTS